MIVITFITMIEEYKYKKKILLYFVKRTLMTTYILFSINT